jgi:hypothetical protein
MEIAVMRLLIVFGSKPGAYYSVTEKDGTELNPWVYAGDDCPIDRLKRWRIP